MIESVIGRETKDVRVLGESEVKYGEFFKADRSSRRQIRRREEKAKWREVE